MVGENLIFGAIGLFLGGIAGGYFAGRYFAREFKGRIEELESENNALRAELREKTDKAMQKRDKACRKEEKRLDKSLTPHLGETPDTATIEKLSEQYRSDAFNAHFAERAVPDDSDDVGEDDEEPALTREERRELRRKGYLQTGDGRTLMTRPFAESLADLDIEDDPFEHARDLTDADRTRIERENARELKVTMIDEAQFKTDVQVKDCATYTYYQEDGILVDDMTCEVETDQEGILGKEAMGIVDETEKDVLYVDNEPDDMLYEIIVDHNMGYYRDVLGF